jgi:GntR family transcriptional regulator
MENRLKAPRRKLPAGPAKRQPFGLVGTKLQLQESVPKYLQIRALLQARFERECRVGDKIQSAVDIANEFGVSRMTVEQALRLLEADGVIMRERGRGTYYTDKRSSRTEAPVTGLLESVFQVRPDATIRELSSSMARAPQRVARHLGLSQGADVIELCRLGVIADEPIVILTIWLLPEIGAGFLTRKYDMKSTIMAELAKEGVALGKISQTIKATLADPSFAFHLGIMAGEAVLEAVRVFCNAAGVPIAYSEAHYRSDRHSFTVTIKESR